MKIDKINPHLSALVLIVVFGAVLRLYRLGELPSGLFHDEAAVGYNAYSVLKTGRDSFGTFMPLLTRYLGPVYVEPLYTYLTVPFVFLFDLNAFSTRLPAAVVGTLTILSTYLLVKEMANEKIALLSALLVAVSPWHLHFSRVAFNTSLVPFFVTLGLYFLFRSLKGPRFFVAGALVFGLSLYVYTVMKFVAPALVALFICFYFREVKSAVEEGGARYPVISLSLFAALVLPIYYLTFFGAGGSRFQSVSVFALSDSPLTAFASNLLSHLSPGFLFVGGDANLRHSIPGFGQVLVALAPFMLVALCYFFYRKDRGGLFLVSCFVIGIIPASLTGEGVPHASRATAAAPFPEIVGALGVFLVLGHLKGRDIRTAAAAVVALLLVFNAGAYLHAYFFEYPLVSEDGFWFGTEEAVAYAEGQSGSYDSVILTSSIDQFYIFPLFHAKLDPREFQRSVKMGKYAVCPGDINECYKYEGRTLFIVRPGELPDGNVKKHIYNRKGGAVLKIVE